MVGLYVSQEKVRRRELLVTLWAGGLLQLLPVLLAQVLVVQPLLLKYLVTNVTGETFLNMEPLMLFQLVLRSEGFVTNRTEIIHLFGNIFILFCIF